MDTPTSLIFDVPLHKYTDNCGNVYTSVTTLIDKYYEKFDIKKMARICELSGRKGNPKYKGKTAKMLEKEWALTSKTACEYGTEKHGYLEDCINNSTGYRKNSDMLNVGGRMLTVKEVIVHPGFGELNLDYFIQTKIDILYPSIYAIIVGLVKQEYRIYAEIGVFKPDRLVSGTIDLLFIKGYEFIILDWKTNKADIKYEAGYFEKDVNGELTTNFIETHKTFNDPLSHVPASTGHKYTFQLSTYAYLCEILGLTCKAIVLCHIRREQLISPITNCLVDRVDFHNIKYMKEEVISMIDHHHFNRKLKGQLEFTV
jgi:hypothetical protein